VNNSRRSVPFVLATVALIGAWLVTNGAIKTAIWVCIPLILGAVVLVGARMNGLKSRAWRYLAMSVWGFGISELLLTAEEHGWYAPPNFAPSYFGYFFANLAMLLAFVQLVKQAAPHLDRMEWIDCAIVTIGPGCLLWQFIIVPLAPAVEIGILDRVFLVGIVVFDFAFALMAWRLLAGRYKLVSGVMLLLSPLLMTGADIAYDLVALNGGSIGGATDVLYPISWSLLAFAPFHKSIRTLTSAASKTAISRTSRHHFSSLAIVASIAPLAILWKELSGGTESLVSISIATVVVFLLVVYRMRLLVGQLERVGKDLQRAATHDSLTGLANRAMLMDRLEHALSKRHGINDRCALVYADLNGFKGTNDTYGHHVGDELLIHAGRRLLDSCRPSDTVARLGGDEFVVLLEGTATEDLGALVDRVRAALSITEIPGGPKVNISASVGVAIEPHDGCSAAELLQIADQGMYFEKVAAKSENGLTQRDRVSERVGVGN
jgi:diguanylate cyclase